MDKNKLDRILRNVEKPARYVGGELNSVYKEKEEYSIHYAFCFPDVYEVGMSHLGLRILYDVLNKRDDCFCERCFTPWEYMERELKETSQLLFSLESKTPLCDFDFVGFTLQYEMSYTNVVNMLKLSNIPAYAKDRDENHPIIMAGGPCVYNVEPVANFFDIVILGEGEEVINTVLDEYSALKKLGKSKSDILKAFAQHKGVYIPSLYDVEYVDGTFSSIRSVDNAPETVEKVIIDDMDKSHWPKKPILPYLQLVHDRVTLEIFRGCTRGCRFCQAGIIYRPVREKSVDVLMKQARENIEATGYDEISLSSLSSGDYSCLKELVINVADEIKDTHANLSLPSLRLDAHAKEYMQALDMKRKAGLTLAPEAGSQRLRDVINKGVTEEDLKSSVHDAFINGFNNVKLYFMIGLPTETMEDIDAIADLAQKVREEYYKIPKEERASRLRITVSTSCFIPKPHTPFQWFTQENMESLMEKQWYLKDKLKKINSINYNYHDAKVSKLEAVFAKGDRNLDKVIVKAVEIGCKFDGWSEYFSYDKWQQAFDECDMSMDSYLKDTDLDAPLPWDHISCGVNKKYLLKEWQTALSEKLTSDCREQCVGCGVHSLNPSNTVNACPKLDKSSIKLTEEQCE